MIENVTIKVCILVDIDWYLVTLVACPAPRSRSRSIRLLSRGQCVETVGTPISGPRREILSLPHPAHVSCRFNQALRCCNYRLRSSELVMLVLLFALWRDFDGRLGSSSEVRGSRSFGYSRWLPVFSRCLFEFLSLLSAKFDEINMFAFRLS